MDFEQLRKDMEDGSPGPWWRDATGSVEDAILDSYDEEILNCSFMREADARRIALVPDLGRIALAAEKYRKADKALERVVEDRHGQPLAVAKEMADARAELFALLTSKDAT